MCVGGSTSYQEGELMQDLTSSNQAQYAENRFLPFHAQQQLSMMFVHIDRTR